MNVEFKNKAAVKHVNVRREWHGDDAVVAVDIKVAIDLKNDDLAWLNLDGETFKQGFWNDDGAPRFPIVPALPLSVSEDKHLVKLQTQELSPVTVKKFSVTPKSNNVAHVVFTVSTEIIDGVLDGLVALIDNDLVDCVVQPLNEELDLEQQQDEAK